MSDIIRYTIYKQPFYWCAPHSGDFLRSLLRIARKVSWLGDFSTRKIGVLSHAIPSISSVLRLARMKIRMKIICVNPKQNSFYLERLSLSRWQRRHTFPSQAQTQENLNDQLTISFLFCIWLVENRGGANPSKTWPPAWKYHALTCMRDDPFKS